MVLENEGTGQTGLGRRDERRHSPHPSEIQKHLPLLDGKREGLVYQPPIVVGTPDSGLLPAQ